MILWKQIVNRFKHKNRFFLQIDGVDISKLGLHELRNQLTIIPQDPGKRINQC